jgi:hypothetical protein
MRRQIVFRLAAGVLIAVGLAHVGSLVPRVLELAADVPAAAVWIVGAYALSSVTALMACVLAAFLLWKAADRPAARLLILFLAFLAIFWGSLFRFVDLTRDAESISVGITYDSGWVSQSALGSFLLAVVAFVRFAALFPRPLTADRLAPARWWRLRRLREATLRPAPVWGGAVVLFLLIRFVPEIIGLLAGPGPPDRQVAMLIARTSIVLMAVGFIVAPTVGVAIGVANLRTSYRLADAGERRRMTWVMVGFSAAAWLILAAVGTGVVVGTLSMPDRIALIVPALFGLAPLLIVLGSAAGVLYGGAIDPALALRRSTVWGFMAAIAVVVFAGLENALSALVEDRLHLPGFAGSMVAGALVAAVLVPVRRPLQRWVTARLPRQAQEPK